jgi:hypothetical protein
MFIKMGLVHLVACVALIMATPDNLTAIWANFIIGAVEFSIGVFLFIEHEEIV